MINLTHKLRMHSLIGKECKTVIDVPTMEILEVRTLGISIFLTDNGIAISNEVYPSKAVAFLDVPGGGEIDVPSLLKYWYPDSSLVNAYYFQFANGISLPKLPPNNMSSLLGFLRGESSTFDPRVTYDSGSVKHMFKNYINSRAGELTYKPDRMTRHIGYYLPDFPEVGEGNLISTGIGRTDPIVGIKTELHYFPLSELRIDIEWTPNCVKVTGKDTNETILVPREFGIVKTTKIFELVVSQLRHSLDVRKHSINTEHTTEDWEIYSGALLGIDHKLMNSKLNNWQEVFEHYLETHKL